VTTRTRRLAGVLFAAILVAAGCGGGDDGGDTAADTVPPTVERFGDAGDIVLDSSELPTTTTGPRDAPTGKVTYAFNTAYSPSWLDPQENPATATPYLVAFALHDALVRHLPGQTLAPSLASSYEMAEDFTSATFTLREGITFHDGTPITPEDVKFTYENYRGETRRCSRG
jgi:peptide/nickel transport system substrate-binding protein